MVKDNVHLRQIKWVEYDATIRHQGVIYINIFLYCSLGSNKMKDEGALILAEALATNETVKSLQWVAVTNKLGDTL